MPVQRVLAVDGGRPRLRSRWRGRPSRPASRSCPCRPARRAWSEASRTPGSYDRRGQQRRPLLGERVVGAQRRARRRTSSRSGSRGPGSVCDQAMKPGGAAYVRVRRVRLPRRGLQPVPDRPLHQPVPRRVEGDLVDPVAVAVVRRAAAGGLVGEDRRARGPRRSPPRPPRATRSATTSAEPCRGRRPRRGRRSEVTTLWPTSGGAWLVTTRMSSGVVRRHADTVGPWPQPETAPVARRLRTARTGRRTPGRSVWRLVVDDGQLLPALPGHRAGRRGGVLRGAVGAAADLRDGRRDRLRHRPVHARPGRRRPAGGDRPRPSGPSPRARSTGSSCPTHRRRAEGRSLRRHLARLRAGPVVGVAGAATCSSTPSRSCTGSAGTGGSSRPARCRSRSTCWRWSPAC